MFEFSYAENIIRDRPTTIPRKNNKISSKETLKSDLSKI